MPELMDELVTALPVAVMVIGVDDRVHAASPAAQDLFGRDIVGRNSATIIRHPAFLDGLDRVMRGEGQQQIRITLTAKTGRDVKLRAYLVRTGGSDRSAHVVATFEDMTTVETAEAMRRDFVANVSHELRTPLTALMGFIETLKGAARDDAAARSRFLAIMEREAGRMIRLVNDLLSLGRVEAEERRRPDAQVDIVGLLRSVMAALRLQADNAGVTLVLEGDPPALTLPGDPDQLAQVFQNLIENALKYAASGKMVVLQVRQIGREPLLGGPAVQIDVIDLGDGIDARHLPRLTERFYRVDTHRSREQGGTGLGLAIVKHIVNRHRGRLKIESAVGKGSRFSVILPEV